jgi:predicted small lipoprotein YifL
MHGGIMVRLLLFFVCLSSVTACGNNGPKMVPVSGAVTIDGAPLSFKTLLFVPESGTSGGGAGASTNEKGEYKLLASRGGALADFHGACPGKYKVVITEPMFPINQDMSAATTGDTPAPAIGLPSALKTKKTATGPSIPFVYAKRETTPLVVTVPDSGGAINIELSSKHK